MSLPSLLRSGLSPQHLWCSLRRFSQMSCGTIESAIRSKLNLKFKLTTSHIRIKHLYTGIRNPIEPKRVSVIGGGSWGTAIANLIAHNVTKYPQLFHREVILFLKDDRLRLTIEKTRQNIRYLSAIKLPLNVKPISSLKEAVSRCDIILFVVPHQYIRAVCHDISDHISNRTPIGVSLVKGLHVNRDGDLERTSEIISQLLRIKVAVLSGANVAIEVARQEYTESTLSPPDDSCVHLLRSLFEADNFKVSVCYDTPSVEMFGALKNIIGCGAGLVDGMGFGINTKAAAIACGVKESIKFIQFFHPDYQLSTILENCGIADTIATCFAGRNRKVMEALVKTNKPLDTLEKELLGGQKLQGPHTAYIVHRILSKRQILDEFPFFNAVNQICIGNLDPKYLITAIKSSH